MVGIFFLIDSPLKSMKKSTFSVFLTKNLFKIVFSYIFWYAVICCVQVLRFQIILASSESARIMPKLKLVFSTFIRIKGAFSEVHEVPVWPFLSIFRDYHTKISGWNLNFILPLLPDFLLQQYWYGVRRGFGRGHPGHNRRQ